MNHLGKAIKRIREEKLLSRKELAKILQCSVSHAINIEKGNTNLSEEKKNRLIAHFDLPVNALEIENDISAVLDDFDHQVGQNIKALRKKLNLTQNEFAEEIGYSGAAVISALESGSRSVSKKKLVAIAEFFDVHVAELLRLKPINDSQEMHDKKLITDIYFLLSQKEQPVELDTIRRLVSDTCSRLRQNQV